MRTFFSQRQLKYIGVTIGGFAFIAAILLALFWWTLATYTERYAPGTSVATVDLSGLSQEDAQHVLDETLSTFLSQGITITFTSPTEQSHTLTLFPQTTPLSASETTQSLFEVDASSALLDAYARGRETSPLQRMRSIMHGWIFPQHFAVDVVMNEEAIRSILIEEFSTFEVQPVDAQITFDEHAQMTIVPDQSGMTFDYDVVLIAVREAVSNITPITITLSLQETPASTRSADLETQRVTVETYLSKAPITLIYENASWTFDRTTIGSWFTATSSGVHINEDHLIASLTEARAIIEQEAQDGRWQLEKDAGGAPIGLTEITASQRGRAIDVHATAESLRAYFASNENEPIAIQTRETLPAFAEANTTELQIKDILGTGHSNMAGSPTNRRKNIARGVELLNGLLIPPGEQLSLVQSIKPFTLENGYVPELVIKGNKTIPEIGGGLCQVGTTLFRGAMESGLPIISRSNHAYAVPYYSDDRNHQPGTDATIYDPAPDFVFENDTPGYILLQTRIEGNDLYFDFWGVSDGRDGSFSAPRVYDWVSPPPVKEIPTTELAPGQRKCTESAHAGVTAEFTYTIKKADGTQIDRVFISKYKPWQAVCLVGQETEKPETEQSAQTNTNQ